MKHFKRILCVLLSLLMTLPLAIASVGATESETPAVKPGTVLYAQDFENVTTVDELGYIKSDNTSYSGTITLSLANAMGEGNKCLLAKNEASTWALHQMVPADKVAGIDSYTISYKMQLDYGTRSWHHMVGVRVGAYTSTSASGTWVTTNYPGQSGWKLQSYNANGSSVASATYADIDSASDAKVIRNVQITVDNANNKVVLYVDGTKAIEKTSCQLGDGMIHLMLAQTAAWIDDISVTAGGIEDVPTTAYGVQTTAVNEGKYDMRFVGAFNGNVANVQKVGFKVVANWNDGAAQTKTFDKNTNTVYSSIKAANGTRLVSATECGGDYLFALTVEEIPTEYPVTFTMTSNVITSNGSTVYGATKTVVATYEGGELKVTPVENVISPEA